MFLEIEGRIKNKAVVYEYVDRLINKLDLGRRYASELNIKFVTELDDGYVGLCGGGPRWAEVEITRTCNGQKQSFFEMMLTLAHEMIHVKQYMKGEISDDPKALWHGRNHEKTPYTKQPWEIEAHKNEHELFAKCFPWEMKIN